MLEANTAHGRQLPTLGGLLSQFAAFEPRRLNAKQNACRLRRRENSWVPLGRIAWLVTVIACLIAVLILALQGYIGYAGVTLAVALSAAINLR